ncbi:hypothetical protein MIR68_004051 [Amoeboaphelidium protococcarum]|nr:hypothetical protein MIR68_004051 [Amoeboaphelidium protococcarum]
MTSPVSPQDKSLPMKPKHNPIQNAVDKSSKDDTFLVSSLAFDFLMMETVQITKCIVDRKSQRDQIMIQRMLREVNLSPENQVQVVSPALQNALSSTGTGSYHDPQYDDYFDFDELDNNALKTPLPTNMQQTQNEAELLFTRLDVLGFKVGSKMSTILSNDKPKMADILDIMKFICKEFWTTLYQKQIDNLKTNHKGVYVLQDNQFKPLQYISSMRQSADLMSQVAPYLAFPSGMIRGALKSLGVECIVTAEMSTSGQQCAFKLEILNFSEVSRQ